MVADIVNLIWLRFCPELLIAYTNKLECLSSRWTVATLPSAASEETMHIVR